MANLSSKQVKTWKKKVDGDLDCIVKSFKAANEQTKTLKKVTTSADSELSYRFNDLAILTEQVSSKIATFEKSFNESIDTYIKSIEDAEKKLKDKQLKAIDQFSEKASEISKLTM